MTQRSNTVRNINDLHN